MGRNLGLWMVDRAKAIGVAQQKEDDGDDDDAELAKMLGEDALAAGEGTVEDDKDDEEDEGGAATASGAAGSKEKQEEEDEEVAGTIDKAKNWSAVNCAFKESKLNFRGVLTPVAFTNWLWYRCVRPKLEETKSKLPEVDTAAYFIDDVEEIMREFMPAVKVDK